MIFPVMSLVPGGHMGQQIPASVRMSPSGHGFFGASTNVSVGMNMHCNRKHAKKCFIVHHMADFRELMLFQSI